MAALAHPTLLAAAVLATGVALVYVHVGRVLLRRPASGQARQALQMFALWWIATALNILLGSLANAAAAFGWTDLSLQVTYILLQRLLLAVALVGLLPDLLSFLALVVPTVGLSVAAVVVARRLPEPQRPQRNRMTLVGLALIVWWVVAVLAGQRQALEQDWYQVFNRVLDLGMALLILWGYEPPDWLRRHVDLPRDLPDEAPGAVASPRP